MRRLFGTDGIRGIANKDLTGDLAYKIGLATGIMLNSNPVRISSKDSPFDTDQPVVLIGSDTRTSKDMIISAVSSGLCAAGVNVMSLGILPTPAMAYFTKGYKFAAAGIMITASHNPPEYNGIKIFGPDGYKLPDELEMQIEEIIENISSGEELDLSSDNFGSISHAYEELAVKDYSKALSKLFSFNHEFEIAVDCSNGAAGAYIEAMKLPNLTIYEFNTKLDGKSINQNCGSTHLEFLGGEILNSGLTYNCGVAFDGDADRCLLIDEEGEIVDGDEILAIIGTYLKRHDRLKNNTIVGTVMSNLGLIKACNENGIKFLSTKVGDKYVLEEMIANDAIIGGEQSGHIIFKEFATTGDGILTALMVLDVMDKTNMPLNVLKRQMFKYPQESAKITADSKQKAAFLANSNLRQQIDKLVVDTLGNDGRAVVRPSGTENCIRVMVEGRDKKIISDLCHEICRLIYSSQNNVKS